MKIEVMGYDDKWCMIFLEFLLDEWLYGVLVSGNFVLKMAMILSIGLPRDTWEFRGVFS